MHFAQRVFKTRIFTANVWLINYFATQLFGVFLKTNLFIGLKFSDKTYLSKPYHYSELIIEFLSRKLRHVC